MKFLFDQKKIWNYILIPVLTTITLFVGFSLGILYSGNQEKEKFNPENPYITSLTSPRPLPLPTADEKPSRGIPNEINKTEPKHLRPISDFDSPHLTHAVYHPRSLGYAKDHTMNVTLNMIYAIDGADTFVKNLFSENPDWNHCNSIVLENRYSQMGFLLTGEPLSQKKGRLLLMSLPVKNYSMDNIKFR